MAAKISELINYTWDSDLRDEIDVIEANGFSYRALLAIFVTSNSNGSLKTPHGATNFGSDESPRLDRAGWAAADWNPSDSWKDRLDLGHDDGADPKPTYDWLLAAARLIDFTHHLKKSEPGNFSREADWHKEQLTEAHLAHRLGAIHTGRGIAHMPGLIDIAHSASAAGRALPPVILRDRNGRATILWTEQDLRELLDGVTSQVNRLESAHNELAERIAIWRSKAQDTDLPLTQRVAAAKAAADFVNSYRQRLKTAAAAYDPDRLPADLETLRAVLTERLEAAAMKRTKEMMKAATQQGVDRGFSCVDEETAVRAIAKQCVLGTLAIQAAEDRIWIKTAGAWGQATAEADLTAEPDHEGDAVPDPALGVDGDIYHQTGTGAAAAKAAFEAAVASIEAVDALNVPAWRIGPTLVRSTGTIAVSGREATVRAQHSNVTVEGRVTITAHAALYHGTRTPASGVMFRAWQPTDDATAHAATITLPAGETKAIDVVVFAANLCGPSKLTVTLTPATD